MGKGGPQDLRRDAGLAGVLEIDADGAGFEDAGGGAVEILRRGAVAGFDAAVTGTGTVTAAQMRPMASSIWSRGRGVPRVNGMVALS